MDSRSPFFRRNLALKASALFVLALLVLAAVFLFAPTDQSWLETKRELEARGEVLDWEKWVPPGVPKEQNLFGDPVAANLLSLKGSPPPPNPMEVASPQPPRNSEHLGMPFAMSNLVALARAENEAELSLAELHDWFAQWDESFARLRAAGKRPKARLLGDFTSPADAPIPNFVAIRTLAQVLCSRAKVHLILGDSTAASEDLQTLEVVMQSLRARPGALVTAMIHVAVAGLYLDTIEEGLRHKLWADAQLQQLAPHLLQMNLLQVVTDGIRAERAAVLRHFSALAQRQGDPIYETTKKLFGSGKWTVERAAVQFSPPSWIRRTQARYARLIQGYLDAIDLEGKQVNLTRIDQQNTEFSELSSGWSPNNALLLYVVPNFSKAATTMARTQTRANQLALACALERFRTRHHCYPKELVQLIPEFISRIPMDIYSGSPIHYELRDDGYELSASSRQVNHPSDSGNFLWQGK